MVTIKKNEEKNGIDIKFDTKPDEDTLKQIRGWGFRWSTFTKCWYKTYTEETMKMVEDYFKNNVVKEEPKEEKLSIKTVDVVFNKEGGNLKISYGMYPFFNVGERITLEEKDYQIKSIKQIIDKKHTIYINVFQIKDDLDKLFDD